MADPVLLETNNEIGIDEVAQTTSILMPDDPNDPHHFKDPPPGVVFFVRANAAGKNSTAIRGDTDPPAGSQLMFETGVGVQGTGQTGVGGVGTGAGGFGVYGVAFDKDATAICGNGGAGKSAGRFLGNVQILYGNLTSDGNVIVENNHCIAIVPRPNDSESIPLFCLATPENWFEDFGRVIEQPLLMNGELPVQLNLKFVGLVNTGPVHPIMLFPPYLVFLTPNSENSSGLYVKSQRHAEFTVKVPGGKQGDIVSFFYRVVARRNDVTAPRFGKPAAKVAASAERSALTSPAPKKELAPKRRKKAVKSS
jgi:hypothetical protein